jgi:hypothetical protein
VVGGELGHPRQVALDDLLIDNSYRRDDVFGCSQDPLDVQSLPLRQVGKAAIKREAI